jgi:hypothetical protein
MVLDGSFRFAATGMDGSATGGDLDFTYTALLGALTAEHTVTKAHRQTDTSADLQSFNFAAASVNLLAYDVIWLIGWEGRNSHTLTGDSPAGIDDSQVRAIATFMAAGGGVFATGDHDGIGNVMCGRIPRIRAMRSWYGDNDSASPVSATLPPNFPSLGSARADTTQRSLLSNYGSDTSFVYFENQSDKTPQPITPTTSPAHPILRRDGSDILVFPDHMHEGNTLGFVNSYDYAQSPSFDGDSFAEFPMIAEHREKPKIIALGRSLHHASRSANGGGLVGMGINPEAAAQAADEKFVNTLSVYDGRVAGVGRIVTGSTFHHYIDINLTGDSGVNNAEALANAGPDAAKTHGFNDAPETFSQIKAVFGNITVWLARPRPRIQLILNRSTFSQAEALANPNFDGAILVTVDGLKPNQFPGVDGITSLSVFQFQQIWAPTITPLEPNGLEIVPMGVTSDDPMLSDRLQRITFTYRVQVTTPAAFDAFTGGFNHVQVDAALTSPAVSTPLTDSAQITLVRSANPFMLDLEGDNTTPWLSSDLKVFPVVAGTPGLVDEAFRDDALDFLRSRLSTMTDDQFNDLSGDQEASALSLFEKTTESDRKVYNFAVARVRLPATGPPAEDVRVFFRIFTTQTTAALTYNESPVGTPIEGYKKTAGATPIALPGTEGAGTAWISFPMFLAPRADTPEGQSDIDNVKNISPGAPRFFGCLIDNNLNDSYLPLTPGGDPSAAVGLPMLMGEHQCIVAQIEYPDAPIPNGANPFTSDKLAQRNIALSPIANPGLDGSRTALHTFEIEATPRPISDNMPPDELLLEWQSDVPDGIEVRLYIPGWNARDVVDLAERFYPRHEIREVDANTIGIPGGGMRYVPIPRSYQRQTGVIVADFPLGVRRGQRFDLSVRQVTTRSRQVDPPPPKTTVISLGEAAQLLQAVAGLAPVAPAKRGVFDLGENRVLITDLRVIDDYGDHAVIVEHPDAAAVAAAVQLSGRWRETIGAFQLGIPVMVKGDMLAHHLRLLSVLRWRAEWLKPNNRWYKTFIRYVEMTAEKVRALGGDPYSVPPTPDGNVPLPGKEDEHAGCLGWILLAIERLIRKLMKK